MEFTEEIEVNDADHDKLLNAVAKLDKTQHIKFPTRSEPTNLNSEFNLIKTSNKLNINDVVKVLDSTVQHVKIGKKIKRTQNKSTVLSKPLEKPKAERLKRSTGYEQTKTKIGRWDSVVARNRTVDYVSFPLKAKSIKLQSTKEFLSKFKLKSPLELELEEVDPPVVEEENDEEEQIYPMSYQEMLEHRQQMAKLRAQQSFKTAKAKRQSKIKSKKYHRLLKKVKLKEQLKEFEELQEKNPEEALKKLDILEKTRALERHTLRHKNTGKWAKNKLIRAKYDKEVRKQLAEQLAVSRSLTHKVQNESSDDEVQENDVIPNFNLSQDPLNPWMLKRTDKSNVDAEFDFGYKKYLKGKMFKKKESDTESNNESDDQSEKGSTSNIINKNTDILMNEINTEKKENMQDENTTKKYNNMLTHKNSFAISNESIKVFKGNSKEISSAKVVSTTNWLVETVESRELKANEVQPSVVTADILDAFDTLEDNIRNKFKCKLNSLSNSLGDMNKRKLVKKMKLKQNNNDYIKDLELKSKKLKPVIDEQLDETNSRYTNTVNESIPQLNVFPTAQSNQETSNTDIDPSHFIQVKPTYLNTSLAQTEHDLDDLDDEEQVVPKVNIEEVFEDDDVVASFRQEKEDEANKDNSANIVLSLPGWGTWGGRGVKPQKRKSNRFILKEPPKMPRKDENKGDIIIKEYKDSKLSAHKVTNVPHPFESVKEYEAIIRAPLGNTFIPEKAHQKLIKPNVITKIGTIIEPINEEELLVPKNMDYKNKSVIKLLAKKHVGNKKQSSSLKKKVHNV